MTAVAYDTIYYIYILLFGTYASIRITCGAMTPALRLMWGLLSPLLLALQGLCLHFFGMETVRCLYPLIVHLPIILCLMRHSKARWDAALISVIIAYSLCQLPRWIGLVLALFSCASAATLLLHIACSQLLLLLLNRWFLPPLHRIISRTVNPVLRFGALPVLYYIYEYFVLFSGDRFISVQALNELLPTGLVLFFMLFVIMYHRENEKRESAENQSAMLSSQLAHSAQEISALRSLQEQTAIYRHDLRHHLMMLDDMISANQRDQAAAYILQVKDGLDAITPVRYCKHETINLLLSAFQRRCAEAGVEMSVKASLPADLPLPDTELCTLLSNGLENALHAAADLPQHTPPEIDIYCAIRQNKLLIEIRNPCPHAVEIRNGLPISPDGNPHYGCRSIQALVQMHQGICTFAQEDDQFILQAAIPLPQTERR